ncbi:MAG: hypothetical protein WEA58_01575 [Balneolaceae bacterium]
MFLKKYKMPLYGGVLTALFTGIAAYVVGSLSGYEAMQLLESSLPRIGTLFNTIILASATILALILTLLGISTSSDSNLKKDHYKQVLNLAWFDAFLFVVTLIFFQLFNIPITESDNVPTSYYTFFYWAAVFISSLVSGLMVAVILMLYSTVQNIIRIVGLGEDLDLISEEEEEPAHQQVE